MSVEKLEWKEKAILTNSDSNILHRWYKTSDHMKKLLVPTPWKGLTEVRVLKLKCPWLRSDFASP